MNKKISLLIILAVVLSTGYTQAQFSLGVRAGFNLTNLSHSEAVGDEKWKPGFQTGVVADNALSDVFSIQLGILFATQGRKTDQNDVVSGINTKSTLNLNYIQVPVNAQYKLDLGGMELLLQAGPYFGYGLRARFKGESTFNGVKLPSFDEKIKMGSDELEAVNFKAFDFGLGLGVGVQFRKLQIVLGYNQGFLNLNNITEEKIKDLIPYMLPGQKEQILNQNIKNKGFAVTLSCPFF